MPDGRFAYDNYVSVKLQPPRNGYLNATIRQCLHKTKNESDSCSERFQMNKIYPCVYFDSDNDTWIAQNVIFEEKFNLDVRNSMLLGFGILGAFFGFIFSSILLVILLLVICKGRAFAARQLRRYFHDKMKPRNIDYELVQNILYHERYYRILGYKRIRKMFASTSVDSREEILYVTKPWILSRFSLTNNVLFYAFAIIIWFPLCLWIGMMVIKYYLIGSWVFGIPTLILFAALLFMFIENITTIYVITNSRMCTVSRTLLGYRLRFRFFHEVSKIRRTKNSIKAVLHFSKKQSMEEMIYNGLSSQEIDNIFPILEEHLNSETASIIRF